MLIIDIYTSKAMGGCYNLHLFDEKIVYVVFFLSFDWSTSTNYYIFLYKLIMNYTRQ